MPAESHHAHNAVAPLLPALPESGTGRGEEVGGGAGAARRDGDADGDGGGERLDTPLDLVRTALYRAADGIGGRERSAGPAVGQDDGELTARRATRDVEAPDRLEHAAGDTPED